MSTIDDQALEWVVLKAKRALAPAEQAAFDAWFAADARHQGAFLRASAIDYALAQTTVQSSLRPQRERLEAEWSGAAWKQGAGRRNFLMGGLAAGVCAFGLFAGLRPADQVSVLTTAKGELRNMPLADNSVASINSASRLEVRLTSKLREVKLAQGEAWFEVAKDKNRPFIVEAGAARVRAVGTAFGVRRATDGAEVLVTEGVVEVWSNEAVARKSRVVAGERAFVPVADAPIQIHRAPEEIERKLAWRQGRLVFLNQSLSEAVADFNRYSKVRLEIADPALNSKKLVGQYQINAPETFARDVGLFLSVPISVSASRIVIGRAPRA